MIYIDIIYSFTIYASLLFLVFIAVKYQMHSNNKLTLIVLLGLLMILVPSMCISISSESTIKMLRIIMSLGFIISLIGCYAQAKKK